MQLLIDAGNSRIKWAWFDGKTPCDDAAADLAGLDAGALAGAWQAATSALYTCVAGDAVDVLIRATLPAGCVARRVRASASECGITSLYDDPAQLGADRWVALIGARSLCSGPLVVATAGTATTVDALDAEGRFLGGYILPGVQLMLTSLARNTAALPLASGNAAHWPRNTDDAIHNAAVDAQAALIERVHGQLGGDAQVLLSGGAAALISPRLRCAHRVAGNLVLLGLSRLALQNDGTNVLK
jgi:type III pantothenate kinase